MDSFPGNSEEIAVYVETREVEPCGTSTDDEPEGLEGPELVLGESGVSDGRGAIVVGFERGVSSLRELAGEVSVGTGVTVVDSV